MVPRSLIPTRVGRVICAVVAAQLVSALVAATEPGDSATDQAADRAVLTAPPGPRTVPLELGVTVFTMWRDWDQHDQWLDRARDSGSKWLRVDMGWCSLEEAGPGKISEWYQGRLDVTVAGAAQRGLKLVVDIGCAPGWAGGSGYGSYPNDPAQFQRVARYLAERYKGKVAAWEIWNEPDCIGGCPSGSPAQFVSVLRAGYQGFKAGDPGVTVVSGGISGNNAGWIKRMYAAGAHGYFDALAVHPYQHPENEAPDAASQGQVYRLTSLPLVHAEMVRNGDGDKPIWFTEFGWSTSLTGPKVGVDEPTQARYLEQPVGQIRRQYPYVSHAFWYCLRDRDDWTPFENSFGLLHVDGSAKPAFAALQRVNAGLGSMR